MPAMTKLLRAFPAMAMTSPGGLARPRAARVSLDGGFSCTTWFSRPASKRAGQSDRSEQTMGGAPAANMSVHLKSTDCYR